MYSLYLYFLIGLSLRNTSKALSFKDKYELRICIGIGFKDLVHTRSIDVKEFHIHYYDTIIQIENDHYWLWIGIEPINKSVLGIHSSEKSNMFVAENSLDLVEKYDKHTVYIDGGRWYPLARTFLHLKHRLPSP
jgi:hypothetical protein